MHQAGLHNKEVKRSRGIDFSDFETPESLVASSDNKITITQLRWALRDRRNNGLAPAVSKFGKRLYINRAKFFEWFVSQHGMQTRSGK